MELKKGVMLAAAVVFFSGAACVQQKDVEQPPQPVDAVERNRIYLAQEREMLQAYIESHKLEGIERNGYGMYELPVERGQGAVAEMGDRVIYSATVYLLDDSGVGQYRDTVELGYSQMELGLHEALEGMREGDTKLVLIPSFLAHGLAGDLDKVPPQSPLRYDLRLIQVVR